MGEQVLACLQSVLIRIHYQCEDCHPAAVHALLAATVFVHFLHSSAHELSKCHLAVFALGDVASGTLMYVSGKGLMLFNNNNWSCIARDPKNSPKFL